MGFIKVMGKYISSKKTKFYEIRLVLVCFKLNKNQCESVNLVVIKKWGLINNSSRSQKTEVGSKQTSVF
ncbi:MAG: hypothetical protein B6I20_06355 [Bacteroidetes bacterium 4572_117]|nr:MAG: hypothetical protein B6I20_06355 [Bacteroidetes bacterium 4572_117]